MRRLRCLLGRHRWVHRRNPEMGGPRAEYEVCELCGTERKVYEGRPYAGGTNRPKPGR